MTEDDRKWHNNWLKMRQVIKTQLKELKNSQKNSKWSKMTENDKKWLIKTQKGPKICFKTDDILRYRVSNKKVPKGPGPLRDARFFASGCYRQEELKTSFSSQFVFVYLSKQNK